MCAKYVAAGLFVALAAAACDSEETSGPTGGGGSTATGAVPCPSEGAWLDETTGLCWENPPPDGMKTWSDAVAYCDALSLGDLDDWRLPNIDEMITLLRGCQDGTETGDLSPSLCEMTPAGCAGEDNCTGASSCSPCEFSPSQGPGEDGCYWDPALSGWCGGWYWSSSAYADSSSIKWILGPHDGVVDSFEYSVGTFYRCVRSGP